MYVTVIKKYVYIYIYFIWIERAGQYYEELFTDVNCHFFYWLYSLHSSSRNENRHQSPTKAKAASNTGNLGVSDVSTHPVRRKLVWDECEDTEEVTPLRAEGDPEEAADADDEDQPQENTKECHADITGTR